MGESEELYKNSPDNGRLNAASGNNNYKEAVMELDAVDSLAGAVGGDRPTANQPVIDIKESNMMQESVLPGINPEKAKVNNQENEQLRAAATYVMKNSGAKFMNSSESESMEMEDGSSISVDSDLFDRSSFSTKSVMHEDGHLNHEKMLGWVLPSVDTSRLRKLAAANFPNVDSKMKHKMSKSASASAVDAIYLDTSATCDYQKVKEIKGEQSR